MKISIITATYNSAATVRYTLESILRQTHQDWEALMVDDGSTDGSKTIAQSYCERDKRFLLTPQENQGQAVARNKALGMVSGD